MCIFFSWLKNGAYFQPVSRKNVVRRRKNQGEWKKKKNHKEWTHFCNKEIFLSMLRNILTRSFSLWTLPCQEILQMVLYTQLPVYISKVRGLGWQLLMGCKALFCSMHRWIYHKRWAFHHRERHAALSIVAEHKVINASKIWSLIQLFQASRMIYLTPLINNNVI